MPALRPRRRALPRALLLTVTLTSTPATACPALSLGELATRLPDSRRYEFAGRELVPFLALWGETRRDALPGPPDGVVLFARPSRPLILAFHRAECLLAVLPSPPADLWRALRRYLGPVA